MMSFVEANVWDITKKQFFYKLKSYSGVYSALLSMHVIAILFSFNGASSSHIGSSHLSFTITYFSGDLALFLTMVWAFIVGFTITKRVYRFSDFAFVGNRLTGNLSNIIFLMVMSLVGGVTATLVGVLMKVILYYYFSLQNAIGNSLFVPPQELFVGTIVFIFYVFLLSAAGYFFGMMIQFHKSFIVIIPALFFGSLSLQYKLAGYEEYVAWFIDFYYNETSFLVFAIKVMATVGLLFYSTILLSKRMEVRQ